MIRARMYFNGFSDPQGHHIDIEKVAASLPDTGDGTFSSVDANWYTVWTPDPKSPNSKWAAASPGGQLKIHIANPHAVRELIEMDKEARGPGGRKNSGFETSEFYVDIKVAPAEDP